ncbi:predicted glycosyl hydrolase [Vibrio mediterranei AK1]|nr:predicted glycosyl hydrolase [Vibrio mediterranei AK1]
MLTTFGFLRVVEGPHFHEDDGRKPVRRRYVGDGLLMPTTTT